MIWWVGIALAAGPTWEPGRKAVDAFNQGIDAYNQGDMKLAERHFQAARVAEPKCGRCTLMWADAVVNQNRAGEVLDDANKLYKRFPNQVEVSVLLANVHFLEQDFEQARHAADVAIGLAPSNPDAAIMLSTVMLRQGDYAGHDAWLDTGWVDRHAADCFRVLAATDQDLADLARAHLDSCTQADAMVWGTLPDVAAFQVAVLTGEADKVQEIGRDLRDDALLSAVDAYNRGDYQAARPALEQVLIREPQNNHIRVLLGLTLMELGDSEGARRELRKASEGDAWVRVDDGALIGVVSMGSELDRLRTVRAAAVTLVQLELAAGDLAAAERALAQAEQVSQGPELDLAAVLIHLHKGELAQANARVDGLLAEHPDAPWTDHALFELADADPAAAARLSQVLLDRGHWAPLYNQALDAVNAQDAATCLALLAPLLDAPPDPSVTSLGYHCALSAGDLDLADTLLQAQGGAEHADPGAVIWHASLLYDRARFGAAAALLTHPETWPDDSVARAWHLRVASLSLAGQHQAAVAHAAHAPAEVRMGVAVGAHEAGIDVTALLKTTCPELNQADQEQCYWLLDSLR